jgi:hypothetical protein
MSGELGAIAPSSEELSGAELAASAGVGEEEIQRLVTHGVLAPRQGRVAPFRAGDVLKIRVARACEEGGVPMEGIAEAIRAGHLSFAFIESWPFERWAARGPRTHAELAEEVGLPFESLQRIMEAFGFARPEPGDAIVEAERPIAALVGRAVAVGLVDEAASVRFGNVYAEALRRIASVEVEVYHSGIEMPLLRSGLGARRTMELAEEVTEEVTELWTRRSSPSTGASRSSPGPSTRSNTSSRPWRPQGFGYRPGNRQRCASSTWRATPD